jgi:hypothetical protein
VLGRAAVFAILFLSQTTFISCAFDTGATEIDLRVPNQPCVYLPDAQRVPVVFLSGVIGQLVYSTEGGLGSDSAAVSSFFRCEYVSATLDPECWPQQVPEPVSMLRLGPTLGHACRCPKCVPSLLHDWVVVSSMPS